MKAVLGEREARDARLALCRNVPTSAEGFAPAWDATWRRKEMALDEGIRDLEEQKKSLESEFSWKIGESGSAREIVTKLAAVTKLTTDLIEGLAAPFPGISDTGSAIAYEAEQASKLLGKIDYNDVKMFRRVQALIRDDAEKLAQNVALDLGASVSPVLRAMKVTKQFAENAAVIADLDSDLDASRKEFAHQIAILEGHLRAMRKRIKVLQAEHRDEAITALFEKYSPARKQCEAVRLPDKP